jgi:hypothetical protein
VAIEGDEVSNAVRLSPQNLKLVAIVDTPGSGHALVYRSTR